MLDLRGKTRHLDNRRSLAFLAPASSIHSVRWINFFVDKGIEISWISLCEPSEVALSLSKAVNFKVLAGNIKINDKMAVTLALPSIYLRMRAFLKKHPPALLHVHSVGTYGLLAKLARVRPCIMTPWGSDILLTNPLKSAVLKFILCSCDHFTSDGDNTIKALQALGVPQDRISKIMFGTDVEFFSPAPSRERRDFLTIISLRQLDPIYDINSLLKSVPMVLQSFPQVRVLIVGDGPSKKDLELSSQTLGIEQVVRFLGSRTQLEIRDLLRHADIYVSTSLTDSGLAASTAEAMSCGLPVVVTDSGDNRAWVVENRGGFVVPCGNSAELAQKVIQIAQDKEMAKNFGIFNRAMILDNNNFTVEMNRMLEIYRLRLGIQAS